MKANNFPKERMQSVSEALSLVQTAERKNRPVQVTAAGHFEIIFQKEKTQTPAVVKQAVINTLLKKMVTEAKNYMHSDTAISLIKLMESMPEIKKPKEAKRIKNLSQEWKTWKSKAENIKIATEKALLENRKQMITDMSAALPAALVLSNMDGDIATLSHSFSEEAQLLILQDLIKLNQINVTPEQKYDSQFMADTNRSNFSFEENGIKIQYPEGDKTEVPNSLLMSAGNDPVIALTLSTLLNQRTFGYLMAAQVLDLPTPAGELLGIFKGASEGSKNHPAAVQYELTQQDNGDFILNFVSLKKGVELTSADGTQTWPMNNGKIWDGPPSQNNFAVRHTLTIGLKKEHLQLRVIFPEFIQPPTVSYCISPDFESIDNNYISSTKDL